MGRRTRTTVIDDLQELAVETEAPVLTRVCVKEKLIPASFKQYWYTIRLWSEFSETVLQKKCSEEDPFPEAPTVKQVKVFLTRFVRVSKGLLEDRITDVTLRNRLGCLKRAIKLHTGHGYEKLEFTDLLSQLPQTEQLSTKAFAKSVAPVEVTADIMRFIWACDEYQFSHPRVRLHLAFALILLTFMGSRPGEFIESSGWLNSRGSTISRRGHPKG